ncbi:hypothetical protein MTO96_028261 [Rhipicephalus appendiculatus]
MGNTSHWRPSQAGLVISTSVVLSLSEELLDKHRYRYVLTGRLVQDCIENISVLRLRKAVPTAYDVKCALKLICVGQFLHTPKSTSYEVDDSLYLTDLLGPTLKDKPSESEDDDEKLEDLFQDDTDVECDILAYFGGFLVKALLKVMTREVVLHLVEYMVEHAQSDPDVHWLLNNARLHVVPSVNIDGSDASIPGDCSGMTGG